ncbi:putative bifunctional UDP-N-acetylmuramoylalanyl-D-glutamate--2,6-diaminopimelate ligase/UDP-N-acetylmuramoyl-tripeptide:D-alanyl-D-alanine ligase [compost metagenome]
MTAALANINALTSNHKVAIIGDMFELGKESPEQHRLIISEAEKTNVETLIFIGKDFYEAKGRHRGYFFQTPSEAQNFLEKMSLSDCLILLKGSRGMALERLLPYL